MSHAEIGPLMNTLAHVTVHFSGFQVLLWHVFLSKLCFAKTNASKISYSLIWLCEISFHSFFFQISVFCIDVGFFSFDFLLWYCDQLVAFFSLLTRSYITRNNFKHISFPCSISFSSRTVLWCITKRKKKAKKRTDISLNGAVFRPTWWSILAWRFPPAVGFSSWSLGGYSWCPAFPDGVASWGCYLFLHTVVSFPLLIGWLGVPMQCS